MSCGFTWNLASQNCARCAVMATGPFSDRMQCNRCFVATVNKRSIVSLLSS
ncbi:Uncharacterized protein APZ42_014377 [Daphnia magna]|uniref:Uncharacterized protein n=1 Tax=Daphnia magna TaxID=35525 RepID=A0A162PY92_9CRUS|nr:Uncharacterized protein APZ42_014377 [Daphnia magna]